MLAEFGVERLLAAVIGHGRRHGDGIEAGLEPQQGLLHLGRRLHGLAAEASEELGVEGQGAMHQGHLGPPEPRRLGQQHPHAAAAGIGDTAGRVEGFAGGAGRHQQPQARPIAPPAPELQAFQGQQQLQRLGHAAIPLAVTGQQPRRRPQGQHPLKTFQQLPVAAHGRSRPHRRVHRCRRQHRRFAGQQGAGQQGVGEPMHPATQAGGTQGRHQYQLRPLGQLHMEGPGCLVAPLVAVKQAGIAAEAGQSHRAHQLGRRRGEQAAHLGTALHQGADHQGHLDRGDAAADGHQDAATRQGVS